MKNPFSLIGSALGRGVVRPKATPSYLPPQEAPTVPYSSTEEEDADAFVGEDGPSRPSIGSALASDRKVLPKYQDAIERRSQIQYPQEEKIGLGRKIAGLALMGAAPMAGPGVLAVGHLGERIAMGGGNLDRMKKYRQDIAASDDELAVLRKAEDDEQKRVQNEATLAERKASREANEAVRTATQEGQEDARQMRKDQTRIALRQAGAKPYSAPQLQVPSTVPGITGTTVTPGDFTPEDVEEVDGKKYTIPPKDQPGFAYLDQKTADDLGISGEKTPDGRVKVPNALLTQAHKADPAAKENPNQWVADATNPDPAISGPAKAKLAEHERIVKAGRSTNQIFSPSEVRTNLDEIAQGLANGDPIKIQQVTSLRSGERSYVMAKARQLNPKFTPAEAERKVKAIDYWMNGKGADGLQSFDTFLQHAAEAESAAGQVWNTNQKQFNRPLSWWKQNMAADPAFAQFMTSLEPVGKEFESFLLNGRALYAEDRASINKLLNENQPFSVTVATLKQMAKTARDRYISMNQRHKNVVGSDLPAPWSPAAMDAAKRLGIDIGGGGEASQLTNRGQSGGATNKPIVQYSESTKQYRHSLDGGQTWLPGQPAK